MGLRLLAAKQAKESKQVTREFLYKFWFNTIERTTPSKSKSSGASTAYAAPQIKVEEATRTASKAKRLQIESSASRGKKSELTKQTIKEIHSY